MEVKETHFTKKKSDVSNFHDVKEKHGPLNPLDLSQNDPELEKENWICVEGIYEKGKISCVIPKLGEFKSDSLQFNVDLSLNG